MTEPVLAILAVLAAVLVGLEQAPIPAPWGIVIKVVATAVAAFLARSQTISTSKATTLIATALKTETPEDPVASARKMVASRPPPPILPLLCLALFASFGCGYQAAVTGVAEAGCIAITDATAPSLEPLCVFGDELAIAIETYIAQHGGTAPAMQTTAKGTAVPHDLYDALAQRPGIKARKVSKPTCGAGTVSP